MSSFSSANGLFEAAIGNVRPVGWPSHLSLVSSWGGTLLFLFSGTLGTLWFVRSTWKRGRVLLNQPKPNQSVEVPLAVACTDWVAQLGLVGYIGAFHIMTKVKTFTVGLPVTDMNSAVEWYRRLLGEVEEINPAPGVWEFQIVPSGWLQLFESEINEPNQSVVRFESHDIEASRMLASTLSTNVDQIETVPEAVRYFEFRDPFGNRLSFYELLA